MVKKMVKLMLFVGLIFLSKFILASEANSVDFESTLSPQDRILLEKNEEMVYMPVDFVEFLQTISSDAPEVKDLIDHVKMGYTVVSMKEVLIAVECMIKNFDPNNSKFVVLKNYQAALLNGDALIKSEETIHRRRRCGKFCTLFVQESASIRNLNVLCNLNVGGTVSASNFTFTGATGCTATSTFPNISACGNIVFNTAGTNTLNTQGAFESLLGLIRTTITLGTPGISLIPMALTPGTALIVGILTPNSPTVSAGEGLSLGQMTGNAFSSGMLGVTPTASVLEYYFIADLQIPLTFNASYSTIPTISQGVQTVYPAVNVGTAFVDANSSSTVTISVSNVTVAGAVLNVVFNVIAQGLSYESAATNAALAINNIISNPTNALYVNLLIDGPVN